MQFNIPPSVLRDKRLTPISKLVWAVLSALSIDNATTISYRRIATLTGCSDYGMFGAIHKLSSLGYIRIIKNTPPHPNTYMLSLICLSLTEPVKEPEEAEENIDQDYDNFGGPGK